MLAGVALVTYVAFCLAVAVIWARSYGHLDRSPSVHALDGDLYASVYLGRVVLMRTSGSAIHIKRWESVPVPASGSDESFSWTRTIDDAFPGSARHRETFLGFSVASGDFVVLGLRSASDRDQGFGRFGAVAIPFWAVLAISAALPLRARVSRLRRIWRARRGLCPECGYDMRASGAACPECGTPRRLTGKSNAERRSAPNVVAPK